MFLLGAVLRQARGSYFTVKGEKAVGRRAKALK
jgi:hypothetical protein